MFLFSLFSCSLLSLFYAAHFLIFYCCDSAKIKHYIAIAIECCSLLYWFFIILSHIKQQRERKRRILRRKIKYSYNHDANIIINGSRDNIFLMLKPMLKFQEHISFFLSLSFSSFFFNQQQQQQQQTNHHKNIFINKIKTNKFKWKSIISVCVSSSYVVVDNKTQISFKLYIEKNFSSFCFKFKYDQIKRD